MNSSAILIFSSHTVQFLSGVNNARESLCKEEAKLQKYQQSIYIVVISTMYMFMMPSLTTFFLFLVAFNVP
jgi:hypothetical protein